MVWVVAVPHVLRASRRENQKTIAAAQSALAEQQALIEQMPAATVRFDVNRRETLYASPQTLQLTGEPPEAWLGVEGYARWVAACVDIAEPNWEQLTREQPPGTSWQNQYRFRRRDGAVCWCRVVSRVVSPGVAQSVVFDATAEVLAEQALAAEQRRYRTLVEQIPAVVFQRAPDGTLEYVSPQIEGLIGYTPEEFQDRVNAHGWTDLVHPDDRARVTREYPFPAGQAGSTTEAEFRVRTRSGGYRHLLVRRARVEAPGDTWYLHTVAVDLTDLRAAESRSRQALAALVRASEDAQARVAVELHDDTLQTMAAVLIQLERIAAGNRLVADHPLYLGLVQMLRETIDRTRHLMFELRPQLLERAGLAAMLADIVKDGPWQTADVAITIDRQSPTVEALCYRTLRELVMNARKHAHATTLRIEGHHEDGWLRFTVMDDGVGFDPAASRPQRALGLHVGLDSVVERVRLAGGEMTITSAPGRGARFEILTPAEPIAAAGP